MLTDSQKTALHYFLTEKEPDCWAGWEDAEADVYAEYPLIKMYMEKRKEAAALREAAIRQLEYEG